MKAAQALVAALILAACNAAPAGSTPQGSKGEALAAGKGHTMKSDWASGGCARPEPVAGFADQDAEAVAATLGEPVSDERFALGAGMNEFRIELRNDLPLPANAALQVRERTWAEGGCRLTLWSAERDGKARVVRAMRWPADAEF